ncbi:MAG: DUF2442 domain-containing protein [Actinomycetota bacterium]
MASSWPSRKAAPSTSIWPRTCVARLRVSDVTLALAFLYLWELPSTIIRVGTDNLRYVRLASASRNLLFPRFRRRCWLRRPIRLSHCHEQRFSDASDALVRVTSVEVIDDYLLRLSGSDGTTREVDLEDTLWGPVFEPLRDPALFAQAEVDQELDTIVWPTGADMDPVVLHGSAEPAGKDGDRTRPSRRFG